MSPHGPALTHLPAVVVSGPEALRLAQGQFLPAPETAPDGVIRVLNEAGALLAVAMVRGQREARLIAPEKVFVRSA